MGDFNIILLHSDVVKEASWIIFTQIPFFPTINSIF